MRVFVTGATGYIGRRLIPALNARGHEVRALVRGRAPAELGCETISGNALDAASFERFIAPADTFVHLVGIAHPAPWKAREFRAVDLVAGRAAIAAAMTTGIRHFIYVSVAQPAPVMRAYIEVRAECERLLGESRLDATILRPWYVLGPDHRWPLLMIPGYRLLEMLPATRDFARRLGLLSIGQMIGALTWAVEHAANGVRVLDVPAIREASERLDPSPTPDVQ